MRIWIENQVGGVACMDDHCFDSDDQVRVLFVMVGPRATKVFDLGPPLLSVF